MEHVALTPPKKPKLARTIAKVLRFRTAAGKTKGGDDFDKSRPTSYRYEDEGSSFKEKSDSVKVEAFMAKLFAGVSSVKAAYAQLQLAQCTYDSDELQSADRLVVSELMSLSQLKQYYVKKLFDFTPENTIFSAEIRERNSAIKTYEITLKKLEFQNKQKDLEVERLKAKLEECKEHNEVMRRKLNESGHLHVLENVHPSGLYPNHFVAVLRHAVNSIRSFVRMMVNGIESAGWDLSLAASAICPGTVFWKDDQACLAFESFLSGEMFRDFQHPCYSLEHQSFKNAKGATVFFYEKFNELRSMSVNEWLFLKPNSTFGKFCQEKYLALIHPDMELSVCEDLTQRKLVEFGGFPETKFFTSFAEMAKRVWLLNCLAFSFNPQVTIFQIRPGSRFSELYMESVADEAFTGSETEPKVAFTVMPGFRIGKTILQSQVYLNS